MRYCQSCGAESRPSFRFCPACGGKQFTDMQPSTRIAAAAVTGVPATAPTAYAPAPAVGQPATMVPNSANAAASINVSAMQYAGFWRRLAAFILDQFFCFLLALIPGFLLGIFLGVIGVDVNSLEPVLNLIGVFAFWLYCAILESGKYQATWGKRVMGLVVCDLDAQRISFARASGRFFARILSYLFLCIGFLMLFFTERNQTLHDKMAKTVVMYKGE